MRKFKTFIGRIIVTIATVMVIIAFFGGGAPSVNQELLHENMELKEEYLQLINRLEDMEELAMEIQEYDNVIYSQILGVDFDTTGFENYRNDETNFILKENETIFAEVDERAWYAAEMLCLRITRTLYFTIQRLLLLKHRTSYM